MNQQMVNSTDSVNVFEVLCNDKVVALILITVQHSNYYLAIRSIQ
jgi:hypothetical protein